MRVLTASLGAWASLMRFIVVGVVAFAVYFLVLAALLEVVRMDYRIAVTIAYGGGMIVSFYGNKTITFQQRQRVGTMGQLARFCIISGINYAVTMGIVIVVVEWLHQVTYLGAYISAVVSACISCLAAKYWVFRSANPV